MMIFFSSFFFWKDILIMNGCPEQQGAKEEERRGQMKRYKDLTHVKLHKHVLACAQNRQAM